MNIKNSLKLSKKLIINRLGTKLNFLINSKLFQNLFEISKKTSNLKKDQKLFFIEYIINITKKGKLNRI